jgi:hypothetical protein
MPSCLLICRFYTEVNLEVMHNLLLLVALLAHTSSVSSSEVHGAHAAVIIYVVRAV